MLLPTKRAVADVQSLKSRRRGERVGHGGLRVAYKAVGVSGVSLVAATENVSCDHGMRADGAENRALVGLHGFSAPSTIRIVIQAKGAFG